MRNRSRKRVAVRELFHTRGLNMEQNDNSKLYMQGNGDDPKNDPPQPPHEPPSQAPDPDRRDYTQESPLPDAIEPDKDWDRK